MNIIDQKVMKSNQALHAVMKRACEKIAPLYPLENFVAVNPFMGYTSSDFAHTASELDDVAGIRMTMPSDYYLKKLDEGKITREDLEAALKEYGLTQSIDHFLEQLETQDDEEQRSQNPIAIVDFASGVSEKDWNRFMVTRVASWIASYYDKGQAYWKASFPDQSLFKSWKSEGAVDRTPDFNGLKQFRKLVASLPDDPDAAVTNALKMLEVSKKADLSVYFNRLLRIMGGWSSYLSYLDWEEKLEGKQGGHLVEFLSVLICWEACFLKSLEEDEVENRWKSNLNLLSAGSQTPINDQLISLVVLQDAFDKALQRDMIRKFKEKGYSCQSTDIKAQAIFCIDVRSEVFRRNLESVNPQIETLGFAGFFGFPVNIVQLGKKHTEAQYPALIKPRITVRETLKDGEDASQTGVIRESNAIIEKIWSSFKSGALTCFGFVSPLGLSYLPKMLGNTFGWSVPTENPSKSGLSERHWQKRSIDLSPATWAGQSIGIPLDQQIELAGNALTAMSMTDNFAEFILFVGHGSSSVNNPYATGLDCGACGGHSGEANAKVAAAILNDGQVREGLKAKGIEIPQNTTFLACLHDTTTDEITLYNKYEVPVDKQQHLTEIIGSLADAGQLTRAERSLKMTLNPKGDIHQQIREQGTDWSQVRPEWGLAGCSSFIIGQRSHTSNINLEGRSFLHDYDWKKDREFNVLETIMTAPMVVTSWINLQYYASSVDNRNLGSGNKTLHNVTSGIGVIEGAAGDLKTGLPWQSVHNGTEYQHEPNRLTVVIEAPTEAINTILKKHQSIADLFDNKWIYLMALDDEGKISQRYKQDLVWEYVD